LIRKKGEGKMKTGRTEGRTEGKMKNKVGTVGTRGRTFNGTVVKKFQNRIVVELERTVRVHKYERFAKKKTKLHARFPEGASVEVGDYVKVRECRPLSKIIHFMLIEVIRKAEIKK